MEKHRDGVHSHLTKLQVPKKRHVGGETTPEGDIQSSFANMSLPGSGQ